MTRTIWRRTVLITVFAFVMGWLLSLGAASAEEPGGLIPSFGDGKLTIIGSGFKAGEHVTITADVGSMTRQFAATADSRGGFRLATGLAVPPGVGVKLDARGDKGTAMAAITAAPPEMTTNPVPPSQLPRAGGLNPLIVLAIAVGLALAGAGCALLGSCFPSSSLASRVSKRRLGTQSTRSTQDEPFQSSG